MPTIIKPVTEEEVVKDISAANDLSIPGEIYSGDIVEILKNDSKVEELINQISEVFPGVDDYIRSGASSIHLIYSTNAVIFLVLLKKMLL